MNEVLDASSPVILSVDDDPQMRRLIDRSLRAEGYATRTCASAEAALISLREGEPIALILLDVMMGGETGFELAHRIRAGDAGEANRELPIVFVTAESDGESYERSFEVGAHSYITKPFDPSALVSVVSSMLHDAA